MSTVECLPVFNFNMQSCSASVLLVSDWDESRLLLIDTDHTNKTRWEDPIGVIDVLHANTSTKNVCITIDDMEFIRASNQDLPSKIDLTGAYSICPPEAFAHGIAQGVWACLGRRIEIQKLIAADQLRAAILQMGCLPTYPNAYDSYSLPMMRGLMRPHDLTAPVGTTRQEAVDKIVKMAEDDLSYPGQKNPHLSLDPRFYQIQLGSAGDYESDKIRVQAMDINNDLQYVEVPCHNFLGNGDVTQKHDFYTRLRSYVDGSTYFIESNNRLQRSDMQTSSTKMADSYVGADKIRYVVERLLWREKTLGDISARHDIEKNKHEENLADVNRRLSVLTEQAEALARANAEDPIKYDGDGFVLCGIEFQKPSEVGECPNRLEKYSIESWIASCRCGPDNGLIELNAADLLDQILNHRTVRLVGPPGTGKTSCVHELAAMIGARLRIIQMTKDKPAEQILGCDHIKDGAQVWVDGELTSALRESEDGHPTWICLDEGDHSPPELQSMLHSVLEGRPIDPGNGENVCVPDSVRFLMTANTSGHGDTTGRHGAALVSDHAFGSRWESTVHVEYMSKENESSILCMHGLSPLESTHTVEFAHATRVQVKDHDSGSNYEAMSEPVCLRHLIAYAKMRSRGVLPRKAFAMSIIGQLPTHDRTTANELAVHHVGAISGSADKS